MLGAQASPPAVCDEGSPEIKEAALLDLLLLNRMQIGILSCGRKGRLMDEETCTHIEAISVIKHPHKRVCEECAKIGAQWLHLRTCQECNATLCCDSSPNQHASKHAHSSGHPVIASAEPGERWLYCYPDDAFAEY
jgi:hypothetical protein